MHCEYSVTYKDFLASMKGYRKLARFSAFVYYLDVWILPGLGAAVALYTLAAYLLGNRNTFDDFFYLACMGLVATIVLPLAYWAKMRYAYRQRTALSTGGAILLDFDESSVRFTIPSKLEVVYTWDAFTAFFEDDQVATLYVQKASFHTIPKRAMDEEGWIVFRTLVNRHREKS
jgi:YcxB-like protein